MIYIHIPFCGSFCTYCDFYSEVTGGRSYDGFVSSLCKEIETEKENIDKEVNTLYIGGGTPSVLPLSAFCAIGDLLGRDFSEYTVEVNPEDIVANGRSYIEGLTGLGVNRISMGVQSFDDKMLKWMNRRHDSDTALKAYGILRDSGVGNISIDLIFGIAHLDDDLWIRTVAQAVALKPQHISAYQLSVESGSALAGMVRTGKYTEAEESQCRRQYDILCSMLADAGYRHYEISNFAIPGYEAMHNSAYWRHVPYRGFGPGAHSLDVEGGNYIRSWNLPNLGKYVAYYGNSEGCGNEKKNTCHRDDSIALSDVRQSEVLNAEQIAIEKIMLGLRTDSGVCRDILDTVSERGRLETLIGKGMLVPVPDNPLFVRIPENFFFISDNIIADLI